MCLFSVLCRSKLNIFGFGLLVGQNETFEDVNSEKQRWAYYIDIQCVYIYIYTLYKD